MRAGGRGIRDFKFEIAECSPAADVRDSVALTRPAAVIFNYHPVTQSFVNKLLVYELNLPCIGIYHEVTEQVVSLQDALTTWSTIKRTEPLPTGTWYPRHIFFETGVGLALYAEIALASAVVLSALIFLAASIRGRGRRRLSGRRDRAWA